MDSYLTHCSTSLRDAFIEALNATMQSFAVPGAEGDANTASRLLADWEAETGQHSTVSDLIRLQCLILLIIFTDNQGPNSVKGQHGGPPKASLLGRAAGLAYAMSLPQESSTLDDLADLESESCIRIRAWWTLVILDRWNAIGTATPLIISNDTVIPSAHLKGIVGEANYRFVCRCSCSVMVSYSMLSANIPSARIHHWPLGACHSHRTRQFDGRSWCQCISFFQP